MSAEDVRRLRDARVTTLTFDNVPLDDVGRLLEALSDYGFAIEINVVRRDESS